ncbi:MAG: class I SAM-dependent methyltransferase [Patescibacteria group bacterium]
MGVLIFLFVILTVIIIVNVLAGSLLVGLVQTGGVPFVSTPKQDFDAILQAAEIRPGEKIYDLGCGKGNLLIRAVKKYGAQAVGYELALWPYVWARWKILLSGAKMEIHLADFFKADISQADVVFCYLMPHIVNKLRDKLKKELKPGSRVVCYAFKFRDWLPTREVITNDDNEELGKIFVYKI